MTASSTLQEFLSILFDAESFSSLDKHFAMFIGRQALNNNLAASLAAALVSRNSGAGNICLDLAEYAGRPLKLNTLKRFQDEYPCPLLSDWAEQLMLRQVKEKHLLFLPKITGSTCGDTGNTKIRFPILS
jgi:hypothetical protein